MKVLSIRRINLEFADLDAREPLTDADIYSRPRADCLHQSDVLKHIAVKIGKLDKGERLEEDYPWRMAMGNMWEEFYFSLKPEYVWQPGELIRQADGIDVAMNCDGMGALPHVNVDLAVIETKCTECKIVEDADDFLHKLTDNWWVYQHQARSYCYGYGPRVVAWPMLHYRGDWRGSGPVAMEYVVEFEAREVEQTWAMIGKYAAELRQVRG